CSVTPPSTPPPARTSTGPPSTSSRSRCTASATAATPPPNTSQSPMRRRPESNRWMRDPGQPSDKQRTTRMTMQLREGLLAFDHAGRPEHGTEPDTAIFRTSDYVFELVTEDGE